MALIHQLHTSIHSIPELAVLPIAERKSAWENARKEAQSKDKWILLIPTIAGLVAGIVAISLHHVPSYIVNSGVGGLIGGLIAQQFYFRLVIPYIKKA